MPSGPVLLCAALPFEWRALARILDDASVRADPDGRARVRGRAGGTVVVLQETGMGLESASVVVERAIDEIRPSCVIASGLAAGLSSAVGIADAIVPDRVVRESGSAIGVDGPLRAVAAPLLPEGRSRRGLLVSVDRVVRTPAEKAALLASTRADAVDMESAAIVERAARAGIPVLVVRAASDTARDELPDLAGLDPSRARDRMRLAGRALASPRTAARLVRLGWGGRRALRTLDSVLRSLLPRLQC